MCVRRRRVELDRDVNVECLTFQYSESFFRIFPQLLSLDVPYTPHLLKAVPESIRETVRHLRLELTDFRAIKRRVIPDSVHARDFTSLESLTLDRDPMDLEPLETLLRLVWFATVVENFEAIVFPSQP